MRVDAVHPGSFDPAAKSQASPGKLKLVAQPEPIAVTDQVDTVSLSPNAISAAPAPVEPTADDVAVAGDDAIPKKQPGVLRLLDAGHFKGVAELRHRIKHFDELQAQANANGTTVANQGVADLTQSMDAQMDETLSALNLDEVTSGIISGLKDDFNAAANDALAQYTVDGKLDLEGFTASMQTAFQSFVSALGEVLASNLISSPTDAPDIAGGLAPSELDAVDGTVDLLAPEPQPLPGDAPLTAGDALDDSSDAPDAMLAIDQLLAGLQSSFDEALDGLVDSIGQAAALPDPIGAQPGNGKAYQKFLDIYNAMRGGDGDQFDMVA